MADAYEHKFAQVTDTISIHYIDVGPRDATPVVLVHGWPDMWFGWRKQIGPLSEKYRVIVPDMRGHGQSSAPKEVEHYGLKNHSNDMARLLDILEIPKAVFIGHDWGGVFVYRMALYHPDRVLGVSSICTPYLPPAEQYVDYETLVKVAPPMVYMQFLAEGEPTAKLLDAGPRKVFTAMFRRHSESRGDVSLVDVMKGVPLSDHPMYTVHSDLLTDAELDVYEQAYAKTGFQSTTSWYAARKIDFDSERGLPVIIPHKALYVGAREDRVLKPEMAAHMPKVCPNLDMVTIEEAGHWILWEQPQKVTETLLNWLEKI
jgi:soluble epoxide hydrolase / lipid-phosphate phosphatase